MSKQSEFDPVATWQNMISQWERQLNELSAKISSNEVFADSMNQATKLSMTTRKSMENNLNRLVQSMQFATQTQMSEALDRLDRIEQKLDAIAAPFPSNTASPKPSPAPPRRTRKPAGPAA